MIKYETIISNFDDKTTLYNWLRKVEEALKHASATNFVVNKKGNATLSFSITFADGTTLESGDIVLQQGESVDGARIASGVLQLHLTNGTWLTAGNIKPVSNFAIDASQHLIVNYQDGTSQDLGAIFDGNVNIAGNFTANSIIENMPSGYYNYLAGSNDASQVTLTPLFAGAVKNGNKLTVCFYGKIKRLDTISVGGAMVHLMTLDNLPMSVLDKLVPAQDNRLEMKQIYLATDYANGTTLPGVVAKSGNALIFRLYSCNNLTLNTDYLFRFEVTFLLSDNLVQ